ncbi:exonuclease V subunit gamma [Rhodohalobacter sp. SW132]|uniref:exodeoxyribonuclease V subunit gamma n=1 Tax=Rhodohalobacter sp. SW132 TaxID=2293433 RepID=UPI000E229319|nr:exodeoxyribonuclease V subunit gamma [Rhodohalobacter sp. SW132]REL33650.1 exonuclease V subunit gamma [Rhodohalobacter sp. SW132]
MLHIYKSHSLTDLAEKLAAELVGRIPEDPFEPVQIVVPNLDTSRWLRLILSKQNGILANCHFLLPAEWQFQQIRKSYRTLPSQLPSDPGPLTWSLFDLLMDDDKRSKFSRPDRYIRMQPEEIKEKAVFQLSARISSVYDQYIVYRPELITGWQKGNISADSDEQWQAKLWNELEKERKKREKGTGFPNKAELILEITNDLKSGKTEHPQPVYFFNPGLIPVAIVKMAENTSSQTDVLVFRMDLQHKKSEASENENALVQAFGEEQKGVGLLYDFHQTANEFVIDKVDSNPDSFLSHVQKSILENRNPDGWTGDLSSVEVRSCHTPLREIENLHQFLLRRFRDDPDLSPDDVLVATPDLETYLPFIQAVFGTEQKGFPSIPYHAGFGGISGSGLKRVLTQLLDLIDSRLSFTEVMDLFLEEEVRSRYDVSESGASRIKRWMEENHVIWGADGDHRRAAGQPESDLQTWQSALNRGWKGMLMGEQDDPFDDGEIHFHKIQGRDREEDWSAFSGFVGNLRDFGKVSESKKTVSGWCDFTLKLIRSFCSDGVLKEKESDEIRRCLDRITEAAETSGTKQKITFRLFRAQFKKQLENSSASTALFSRGVTFSTMVPVRSIPAKVVALIGLNEADFPRKPKSADFDLMARNPAPTDRNRKNEDRNLFLESVMAAGDVHYCSYIGMSRVDNEPIPPSPIVNEWVNFIADTTGKKAEDIVHNSPLHGFSRENFRKGTSFAKTEFLASERMFKRGTGVRGLQPGDPISIEENGDFIPFEELDRFYANPVQTFFKSRFNPEINRAEERKKEFELSSLEYHKLFDRVFGWRMQDKNEDQILNLLYRTGTVPQGWQGETVLREIIHSVDSAIEWVREEGFEPQINNFDLNIQTESISINGSLLSYSAERMLDITPSGFNGGRVFRSWIRHLCGNVSGHFPDSESNFLCDLKKPKPKWIAFQPVKNAEEQLELAVRIFRSGIESPIMLFPSTSYAYEKAIFKENGIPEESAAQIFEGSEYNRFAENRDLFVTFLAGDEPDFEPEYIHPQFRELLNCMMNHMEPVV